MHSKKKINRISGKVKITDVAENFLDDREQLVFQNSNQTCVQLPGTKYQGNTTTALFMKQNTNSQVKDWNSI